MTVNDLAGLGIAGSVGGLTLIIGHIVLEGGPMAKLLPATAVFVCVFVAAGLALARGRRGETQ
jgi:hypothetical protein